MMKEHRNEVLSCNPMTQKTKADDLCAFGVSLGHAVVLGLPWLQDKTKQILTNMNN